MTNFTSFIEWFIATLCDFLTREPIIYFTTSFLVIEVLSIFKTLISNRKVG